MYILLVILSAIFLTLPVFIKSLSPFLFFGFVPLIYGIMSGLFVRENGFKVGFWWGVLVYGIHLYWLSCLLIYHGRGFGALFVWILIVSWFALCSGLWMKVTIWGYDRIKKQSLQWVYLIFALSFYLIYIETLILFPAGRFEGYCLGNPFILLGYYPPLLWILRYIGFSGGAMVFAWFHVMIARALLYHRVRYFFYAIFGLGLFLVGYIFYSPHDIKLKGMGYIQPWWYGSKDCMYVWYRLLHDVTEFKEKNRDCLCVILPESSFPGDLYEYQEYIKGLQDCSDLFVVVGAQAGCGGKMYNSCFLLFEGEIVKRYDKQHLIPLMERRAFCFDMCGCGASLSQEYFCYGLQDDDEVNIGDERWQLFLCSEFFFQSKKIKGLPILFLCNDYWFCCSYMREMVPLFVTYISTVHGVDILYATVCGKTNVN